MNKSAGKRDYPGSGVKEEWEPATEKQLKVNTHDQLRVEKLFKTIAVMISSLGGHLSLPFAMTKHLLPLSLFVGPNFGDKCKCVTCSSF